MEKLFKGLHAVLYWVSVSAMTLMLVLIFLQVISRYFFGHTFEWSEELSRFLFVWVVFLGSALIMGESGHLSVQLLARKLEGTAAGLALEVFVNVCSYVFILLLLVQGAKMTSVMTFQTAPGLGISMSSVYAIIPASACLMMLYLFKDTVRIAKAIKNRNRPAADMETAAAEKPQEG
ncbi:TRAP transporter small permease [Pseudodesulfovibrio senegalensis]|jgi:TRAP-type C4-dicarboxylate transport system permease small subunit|uniref:TRAP transporter small permease n=1 Tax=Pseudodesulfovibrio senegalensis TaxID=1721087 RepID=A0A6N6N5Q6_9BACT|nr:TRAP transporter small permease [Pseudodesulfovibrio senegalensis]KAB1442819.1 TRAP transporter small permease [Pseudodesulfovibrio senegalensis]